MSQKDKKPRLKKSEKGRTEGMDKKSYSKYSLKINLQNTSYFKRISQRTSLASPVKMQVGSHSKGKTTLNLPDLENTCRNINSHYCTALKSFMYENVPVCFFLQHRKKEITHFFGALKRTWGQMTVYHWKSNLKCFLLGSNAGMLSGICFPSRKVIGSRSMDQKLSLRKN